MTTWDRNPAPVVFNSFDDADRLGPEGRNQPRMYDNERQGVFPVGYHYHHHRPAPTKVHQDHYPSAYHQYGRDWKTRSHTDIHRPSLVDKIQRDYPRTPSPVFVDSNNGRSFTDNTGFPTRGGSNAMMWQAPPYLQGLSVNSGDNSKSAEFHQRALQFSYYTPMGHASNSHPNSRHLHPRHHSNIQPSVNTATASSATLPTSVPTQMSIPRPVDSRRTLSGNRSSNARLRNSNRAPSLYSGGNRMLLRSSSETGIKSEYSSKAAYAQKVKTGLAHSAQSLDPIHEESTSPILAKNRVLSPHKQSFYQATQVTTIQSATAPSQTPPIQAGHSNTSVPSKRRSNILEDFKNNKRKYELRHIYGNVVEFSGDQHGSRFIQQKLEMATRTEKELVFNEMLPNALDLMTDVFGNYVIQKFFDLGTPDQRGQLGSELFGNVVRLSTQMYGCRVVQKALDVISDAQRRTIVKELKGNIFKCVKDQNGNHVIQKCIETVSAELIKPIVVSFYAQVLPLATHPYGCRVIQRVLEFCPTALTDPILKVLLRNTVQLVQDQYGNYVIQHVLEGGCPHARNVIIQIFKGHVLRLSQHKFASNVIEKCVEYGTDQERGLLIREILAPRPDGIVALHVMMKDQYANYVVQKMLDVTCPRHRELLVKQILPYASSLKKFTYGKHITVRLERKS